jgi:hypothetical protein
MTLDRLAQHAKHVGRVLLLFLPCGCSPPAAAPVLPKALAPVRPLAVQAASLPAVKFVEITKEAGINFIHKNGAFGDKLLPETMGSGVAFLDYDRDGDQDLFFVNSSYWPGHEQQPAPTQALGRLVLRPGCGRRRL